MPTLQTRRERRRQGQPEGAQVRSPRVVQAVPEVHPEGGSQVRLLVCGSREWSDGTVILDALRYIFPAVVIHGGCGKVHRISDKFQRTVGADLIAGSAAERLGIAVDPYPVDHAIDGPWPGAGPRRNARMLRDGKPDRGLAFGALWKPETAPRRGHGGVIRDERVGWRHTGTGGMCALMLTAGLPVRWIAAPGAAAVDLVTMPTPGET